MNLNSKKKQEAIRSYLRIKPIQINQGQFLEQRDSNTVVVRGQQQYTFNHIFNHKSNNQDLFEVIGDPIIQHSLQGYNACILAYGQTSSGKTYTMKGCASSEGLIPLTLRKLFQSIHQRNMTAQIRISYFQIYNENIIDLLGNPDTYLQIREDYRKNISIIGIKQMKVQSVEQAMQYFEQGESKRKFSSNNLNHNSSRSHTIFKVSLDVAHEDFSKSQSFINMVDLAGSQSVSRTNAQGSTRKEGDNINKSILALSKVIRYMSQKQNYVNFRDSKLTRILQSSLCSNSRSIVICTVNPIPCNLQQTINTLKFGVQASNIKLNLKQNFNRSTSATNSKTDCKAIFQTQINEENNTLLAKQRIQYQQNKRLMNYLREQNRQLREAKRKLDEKVEFIQLELHKQEKTVKNYEEELERHRKVVFKKDINMQQRQVYENKIEDLKSEMNIMADKYDALNQYSSKLQKNQRYLVDRIAKYQSQLEQLKLDTFPNQNINKPMTPKKPKVTKPKQRQSVCPLTIGSIVILKAQIIQMRKQACRCHEQVARLMEQRNQLCEKIEHIQNAQNMNYQTNTTGKINPSHHEEKQIKTLLIKIKRLKKQITFGKNRQKKLIRCLKQQAKRTIQQYDQFNQWLQLKHQQKSAQKAKQI